MNRPYTMITKLRHADPRSKFLLDLPPDCHRLVDEWIQKNYNQKGSESNDPAPRV